MMTDDEELAARGAQVTQWHLDHPYKARDEVYIDIVLAQVRALWLEAPHQRLGQLLTNTVAPQRMFFVRDEEFFRRYPR